MPTQHMETHTPFITFRNTTLRLGDHLVFRAMDWALRAGEHWAVVGANGSGKSTLLRALMGEVPVVRGEIEYHFAGPRTGPQAADYATVPENEIACVSVDDHRQRVAHAMSFHQARWAPVEQPGGLPTAGGLAAEAAPEARARRVAAWLGISHLRKRPITQLSNGEMRKTLLARALAQQPRLLLLDEPFAGLDRASRRTLNSILNRLMAEGLPVVLATARPDELPGRINRVLLVDKYRVVDAGPRRTLARRAAAFIRVNRASGQGAPVAALPSVEPGRGVPETLAVLHHVRATYGRARVLAGVDWTIRRGEKWALLGPNGAGKSTLLSLILGDNPQAYANDITLFGVSRGSGESIWDIKGRIGWMAPELQFHYDADTPVLDVVCSGFFDSVGLYACCTPAQRRRSRAWLRALALETHARDPFGLLSDGEQRLVLLARALVKRPWLTILDEPAQGLDPRNRTRVLGVIEALCQCPAATLVYVTHHANEVPGGVSHELQLRAGRVTGRRRRISSAFAKGD